MYVALQQDIAIANIHSGYETVENCPDICFLVMDSLTSPLIMYSKFIWSNLL